MNTIEINLETNTERKHKAMTYKEFLDKYELEIVLLDVYDENGCEIDAEEDVPDDAIVLGFSRRSGSFDVEVSISGNYGPKPF